MRIVARDCPLCGGKAGASAFPYAIRFADVDFSYVHCSTCETVYVDPVPDDTTFARMYAKADYHDKHYSARDMQPYREAAELLRQFAPAGASVLDYGCGFGGFLKAVTEAGYQGRGIEFDAEAARSAQEKSGCPVTSVREFLASRDQELHDVVHLGDVLEHLPDPASTLKMLVRHCKPGGLVFAEGPLEANPSPVYWAARAYGAAKRAAGRRAPGAGTPTHLFRTNARDQLAFFRRVEPGLTLLYWQVTDDGWPYSAGGALKRAIATAARGLGGWKVADHTLGNRFRGVFKLDRAPANTVQPDAAVRSASASGVS